MTGWLEFETALQVAKLAHAGQVDKGGIPMIHHAMRVAVAFDEPLLATVAILHDVVEDSAYDLDYIHHMFGDEVSEAVEAISRVEGETYHDYIVRCSKNPLATKVKQQDLHDHLMRLHKIPDQETKESLEKRYKAARAYIEMVIHG